MSGSTVPPWEFFAAFQKAQVIKDMFLRNTVPFFSALEKKHSGDRPLKSVVCFAPAWAKEWKQSPLIIVSYEPALRQHVLLQGTIRSYTSRLWEGLVRYWWTKKLGTIQQHVLAAQKAYLIWAAPKEAGQGQWSFPSAPLSYDPTSNAVSSSGIPERDRPGPVGVGPEEGGNY